MAHVQVMTYTEQLSGSVSEAIAEAAPAHLATEETRPPGIGFGIWTLIKMQLLPVLVFIPAAIAGVALGNKDLVKHPLVMLLGMLFAAGWIIRSYCRRNSIRIEELAGPLAVRPGLLLAIATAVVGLLLIQVPVCLWLLARYPSLEPKLDFGVAQSPWAAFLLIVVFAPLAEEFIFRGILLQSFIPRYGRNGSVLLSAALFALSHVFPVRFLGTMAGGMLLGWLAARMGSVWPGVWAHAFNNAIAFGFMIFAKEVTPPAALQQLGGWAMALPAAGAMILSLGIYGARRAMVPGPASRFSYLPRTG